MDNPELNLIAKFDQINACHRDALASFRKFASGMAMLPEDERQEILAEMTPMELALLRVLATEAGDKRLQQLFGETPE